jgi:hypothetical protein
MVSNESTIKKTILPLSSVNELKVNEELKAGISDSKIIEEFNVVKQTL